MHDLSKPYSQALANLNSDSTFKRTSIAGAQKGNLVGKMFGAVGVSTYGKNAAEYHSHSHAPADKVGVLILNLGGPEDEELQVYD